MAKKEKVISKTFIHADETYHTMLGRMKGGNAWPDVSHTLLLEGPGVITVMYEKREPWTKKKRKN